MAQKRFNDYDILFYEEMKIWGGCEANSTKRDEKSS